jgi:hypothetical protein
VTSAERSGFSLQPQFRELLITATTYKISLQPLYFFPPEITKQELEASHPPSAAEAEGPWAFITIHCVRFHDM